jgi:cobalamin biosynthesis Mg chelatase CobN
LNKGIQDEKTLAELFHGHRHGHRLPLSRGGTFTYGRPGNRGDGQDTLAAFRYGSDRRFCLQGTPADALYLPWHEELPASIKTKQTGDWGEPPGDLFAHENRLFFAGLKNGHVFLTLQPPRG